MISTISRVASLRGPTHSPAVQSTLAGTVRRLSLFGPGGNAPPSGLYLVLEKPVQIEGRTFDKVYLPRAELPEGASVVLSGYLSMATSHRVTTLMHWAELNGAVKLEVEPPQAMQRGAGW